jgi:hypothetical protein
MESEIPAKAVLVKQPDAETFRVKHLRQLHKLKMPSEEYKRNQGHRALSGTLKGIAVEDIVAPEMV